MDLSELKKACTPAFEFLRRHGNPHESILITYDSAKVVSDEAGIPLEIEHIEDEIKMTYKEAYLQCQNINELKRKVQDDIGTVRAFLGGNPDRLEQIELAMNEVIRKRGWNDEV